MSAPPCQPSPRRPAKVAGAPARVTAMREPSALHPAEVVAAEPATMSELTSESAILRPAKVIAGAPAEGTA